MGGQGFGKMSKTMPGFDSVPQRRVVKVGRNDPCPCGSGKKYKDCHEKDGTVFLEKLALQQEKQRLKQDGVPWYRRLLAGR